MFSAHIAFLVMSDERNIGDQRLLEYKCLELEPSIVICRYTLNEIYTKASLDANNNLIM
jgi:hypothetical protein